MDIRTMIGQRLAFGFPEKKLSSETIAFIREYKIGNLVIFRNNVENNEQLRKLCEEIQNLVLEVTGYPAFICIDQEGGMVSRLSNNVVIVPGNMAAAAAGGSEIAYQLACIISRQLRGIGLNLNFAPAVDVNSNPKNPVIGVRSFGDDPIRVAEYSAAAVRGYLDSGMMCCAKHFPGHGDT
ncbi:MAG: glycoside hydrolase family 3 protein, partial [Anaerolineaceae bacterium]|nr:glycoside hydrolase family 3 protein [Anaerolineaceae bacterium]